MERDRLRVAVEELSGRQREVLRLSELEGFSGPEVAEMLGIAEGTVRWHLHQARATLRDVLSEDEGAGPADRPDARGRSRDAGAGGEGEER